MMAGLCLYPSIRAALTVPALLELSACGGRHCQDGSAAVVSYPLILSATSEEGVGGQPRAPLAMVCMRVPQGFRGLAVTPKWPSLAGRMKSRCYGFEAASTVEGQELHHTISYRASNSYEANLRITTSEGDGEYRPLSGEYPVCPPPHCCGLYCLTPLAGV